MAMGQWHNMDITSWTLWTLEKCPSGNENKIEKSQKLHGVLESILVHSYIGQIQQLNFLLI